jgi:DNA-binding transcriptional LysR family regulator
VSRDGWLGIEFRHLVAVATVVEEGSFRRAAERLGYVQSAISQQVAYLEQRVGARLLERSRGSAHVKLTKAGEVFLEHAGEIMVRFEAASAELSALSNGASGSLRVGVFDRVASRLMPMILTRLRTRLPDVRIAATETATDGALFELVERGSLDMAFADLPLETGPFESLDLLSDPLVLVVGASSSLCEPLQLGHLNGLPLIGSRGCRALPRIESQLRSRGVEIEFAYHAETLSAVHSLVAAGIGAAILPWLAARDGDPETRALSLDGLLPARRTVLYWREDRQTTPAMAGFREVAQDLCSGLVPAAGAEEAAARSC